MRICIYTESALPMLGGQELVVDALARQFLQKGHEPLVLAPPPRSPLTADDARLPYPVVRHPRFVSTRRLVEWYQWSLSRLHRRFPFDVLHCHSVFPTGYLGVLTRARLGVPVVITSHGGDVAASNHRLKKPGVMERNVRALAGADALIAISRFTREGYQRLLPSAAPIRSIPNGVSTLEFTRPAERPLDLSADIRPGEYFLFIGRLSNRKGVDVLVDALAEIPASRRPQIVLAGIGEEQAALEQKVAERGLADKARFVGRVVGRTKNYLLQNSIATVIPSRDWEAFPLVVLESYAAGRPVIASQIPGLEDLVEPGSTGWLVPSEAPVELAQALSEALDDRSRTDRLGRTARDHARHYDWSAVADRHLELFDELLSRRAAA